MFLSVLTGRLCNVCEQTQRSSGEQAAVGKLLDYVARKLVDDDVSAFKQLIYSLVRTEQLQCAALLDKDLTDKYLQEFIENDSEYG